MIPYVLTNTTLTYIGADGCPVQVLNTHDNFDSILSEIRNGKQNEDTYCKLDELRKPVIKLIELVQNSSFRLVDTVNGVVEYLANDEAIRLPQAIARYILAASKDENFNFEPLENFIKKLLKNPDERVRDELWDFISTAGLCLTPSGNVMAYKNVNHDFTSIYDGVTDNTPDTVLVMPRKYVNTDRDQTCSDGLHFAAYGYLQHYSRGANGKTVLLSINPADIVSIPSDYNFMKGRACRYKVVREVEAPDELKKLYLFDEEQTDWSEED